MDFKAENELTRWREQQRNPSGRAATVYYERIPEAPGIERVKIALFGAGCFCVFLFWWFTTPTVDWTLAD
eukprot:m.29058 g.29058  ORF g.29058 m.29058 type:complete len:70 (-) comp8059_c1_seq1:2296-2505(-)